MKHTKINSTSIKEGNAAEDKFIACRAENIIRKATKQEDIHEHWDVLDKEFGKVDVKAQKRINRGGSIANEHHWYELKTVKKPPKWQSSKGWGIPNGIKRLIAFELQDSFVLVNPEDIIEDLRFKCKERGKGEFLLYGREGRGDLMTLLPTEYLVENSFAVIPKHNEG